MRDHTVILQCIKSMKSKLSFMNHTIVPQYIESERKHQLTAFSNGKVTNTHHSWWNCTKQFLFCLKHRYKSHLVHFTRLKASTQFRQRFLFSPKPGQCSTQSFRFASRGRGTTGLFIIFAALASADGRPRRFSVQVRELKICSRNILELGMGLLPSKFSSNMPNSSQSRL